MSKLFKISTVAVMALITVAALGIGGAYAARVDNLWDRLRLTSNGAASHCAATSLMSQSQRDNHHEQVFCLPLAF
jgi:hypothetical protein